MMRTVRVIAMCAGLLSAAPLCIAAEARTSFAASATVVRGCIIATTNLAFGSYPAVAAGPTLLATSTIRVTCQLGDTYTIGLDDGVNRTGSQRRMARTSAPVSYLNYDVYKDASRTQAWGDTGGTRVSAVGTGGVQTYTVFGRLPGAQVVPAGAYVDTVTVTVRN
jgi:spore coat protein U-like protein